MDALLTQRQIAQQIVDAGGDYGMVVKENQPHLLEDIAPVLALAPIAGERRTAAATLDFGHGRIEKCGLQTSTVLMGYSDWPGLAQVFHLERQVIIKNTGEVREEVVAGLCPCAHPSHYRVVAAVRFVGHRAAGRCGGTHRQGRCCGGWCRAAVGAVS